MKFLTLILVNVILFALAEISVFASGKIADIIWLSSIIILFPCAFLLGREIGGRL